MKDQHITQWFMWKPNLGKTTVTCYLVSHSSEVMPCERPSLLKVRIHTIKCDPVKGFQSPYYKWPLLEDFRPFTWNDTLLKDFSTLFQRIYSKLIQLLESNSRALIRYNLQLYLQIIDLCSVLNSTWLSFLAALTACTPFKHSTS